MIANNLADVLLNLGRTMGMHSIIFPFFSRCDSMIVCLLTARIYFISIEQMVRKVLPDPSSNGNQLQTY